VEADRTLRRYEKLIHDFSGKPDRKERIGVCEDNIEMDHEKVGCESMD
jgi:hypothetical protein